MRWSLRPPPKYAAETPVPPETSIIPPADPDEWRREAKKFRKWWQRAWDWLTHAGRMVSICVGIGSSSVAIHAGLRALELKNLVQHTIEEEVKKQTAINAGRIENLESRMAGVPEWRGQTTILDSVQNQRLQELERRAANCEQQQQSFYSLLSKGR